MHKRCSRIQGALTRVKVYDCELCKSFYDDEEEVKYVNLEMI